MIIHYDWSPTGSNRTVCGAKVARDFITTERTLVQCSRCRRSQPWRLAQAKAIGEALRLTAAWGEAVDAVERSLDPSDRLIDAEQNAYDALVDHVDAEGLTYTELDPRGPAQDD